MPQWYSLLQGNAAPSASSALASSELPTVESIYSRSGKLRRQTCRSAPCVRAALAALASLAAIAFLVLFCSRLYRRPAVQRLLSRRLASSGDSDAPLDACGNHTDEDEQQQPHSPHLSNAPADSTGVLPLKKRSEARTTEGANGVGRDHQQQEQQHHYDGAITTDSGVFTFPPTPMPEHRGPRQLQSPTQLGAATDFRPQQRAVRQSGSNERRSVRLEIRLLRRQMRRMQQQLQRLERQQRQMLRVRRQWQLQELQQLEHLSYLQHVNWQQQQQQTMYWQYMQWQNQQQQHSLLQQQRQPLMQLQGQQYLMQQQAQQQLLQQQGQQQMAQQEALQQTEQYQGQGGAMQGGEQQQQQGEQQPKQVAWKQQAKQNPLEEEEQQQLQQRVNPLSGDLQEDEWIDRASPMSEAPQPSTSEQVLKTFALVTEAGPSSPELFRRQATPGQLSAYFVAFPGAAPAGVSTVDASAAPSTRDAAGSAAATWRSIGTHFPAWRTLGGDDPSKMMDTPSVQTRDRAEHAGAAAVTPNAAEIVPAASGSTTEVTESTHGAQKEHPFLRIPKLQVPQSPFHVDILRAMATPPGKRSPVPLLQKARDLLVQDTLSLAQMRQLANVGEELISHGTFHQQCELSNLQTYRAVERLAMRFLVMDALLSIFTALGQQLDMTIWKRFTDLISHEGPSHTPRAKAGGRANFFASLATRLSSAIQVIKTGKRPEPEDILLVKRMLFCSAYSPVRFREKDFDAWRVDDLSATDER